MDYAALRQNDERLLEAIRLDEEGIEADEIARRLGYENAASVKSAVAAVRRDFKRSEEAR